VIYADDGFARYASADDETTAFRIAGITTHAASPYADVQILTDGPLTEPSWNWDINRPIFLGINGVMTQDIEAEAAYIRVVGFPTGSQSMLVDIQDVIFIGD
jgi:hypothetical protein